MRIYINKNERSFLRNILFDCLEDYLSEGQLDEEFQLIDHEDLELVSSLLKKLSEKPKRDNLEIRYVYERS